MTTLRRLDSFDVSQNDADLQTTPPQINLAPNTQAAYLGQDSTGAFWFNGTKITGGGGGPTGPAGGDLGGTYPNPTVLSVADVTTGVLTPANGGVAQATVAGTGCLYFPTVTPPNAGGFNANGLAVVAAANEVELLMFVLPWAQQAGKFSVNIGSTTFGAGSFFGAGIYDLSGNRLVYSNPISASTNTRITGAAVATTILNPGVYYMGWTATTSSGGMYSQGFGNPAANANVFNSSVIRFGKAANASSGGTVPATLGAISTNTITNIPFILVEP